MKDLSLKDISLVSGGFINQNVTEQLIAYALLSADIAEVTYEVLEKLEPPKLT